MTLWDEMATGIPSSFLVVLINGVLCGVFSITEALVDMVSSLFRFRGRPFYWLLLFQGSYSSPYLELNIHHMGGPFQLSSGFSILQLIIFKLIFSLR